jgi:hypothetical protein
MPHDPQISSPPGLNATSKMSFAVATCAFAAALVGLFVNQWMSGWMAVGGMAGVGLFYIGVGLLNLGHTGTVFSDDNEFVETSSHRLSGAGNVDDLAIERTDKNVVVCNEICGLSLRFGSRGTEPGSHRVLHNGCVD